MLASALKRFENPASGLGVKLGNWSHHGHGFGAGGVRSEVC